MPNKINKNNPEIDKIKKNQNKNWQIFENYL